MESVCDHPQHDFLPHSFHPFHKDIFFGIKKGGGRGRFLLLIHKGNLGAGGDLSPRLSYRAEQQLRNKSMFWRSLF